MIVVGKQYQDITEELGTGTIFSLVMQEDYTAMGDQNKSCVCIEISD